MFGVGGKKRLQIIFRRLRRTERQLHGATQQQRRHVLGRGLEHQLQIFQRRLEFALAKIEQGLRLQHAQVTGRTLARAGQLRRRIGKLVLGDIEIGQFDARLHLVGLELEDLLVGQPRRAIVALQALQVALQAQRFQAVRTAFQGLLDQQLRGGDLSVERGQAGQSQQRIGLARLALLHAGK